MDDPLFVRGFERLSDLLRDGQRLVERDRTTRNKLRQVVTVDEFHHQRGHAPALFQAVDSRDVRVIQRRQRLGFTLEAREPISVVRDRLGRILIATSRSSFVSRARKTCPMPPSPMLAITS